jgi:Flp pilus assembly protein TadG
MRRRDETGSITPFVVIVSLAIILLAALVVDGGRQLNGKGRAVAYAQEAARAGAQAVDVADARLDLLPDDALKAARQYCQQAMAADQQLVKCRAEITRVDDPGGEFNAVTVSTEVRIKAILLGMIGKPVLTASGQALARPVSGISGPDSGKIPTVGPPSVAPPATGNPTATAPPTPAEIEVTPCTPKETDEPTPSDEPKDDDNPKDDEDKPEECKEPD